MIGGYHSKQFLKKALAVKRRLKKDTQRLRVLLLDKLEELFKIAEASTKAESTTAEEAQNWMRIMGYLSQVMNSLAKSFDEAKAMEYLENLERMVSEAKGSSGKGEGTREPVAAATES